MPSSSPPVTPSSSSRLTSIFAIRSSRRLHSERFHVERLLGEVEHVRAEQRLAGLAVERLAVVEHALDPRDQLLVGVVGVEDDAHAVVLGDHVDVARRRDGAEHLGERAVRHALAGEELRAAVGELDDDVRLVRRRRLEHGVRACWCR